MQTISLPARFGLEVRQYQALGASSLYEYRVASPSLPMASTRLGQGGHDQTVGRRSGGFDFPLSERSRSLRASGRLYFAVHQDNIWFEASTKRTSLPNAEDLGFVRGEAIFVLPRARHRRHLGRSHLVEKSVKSGPWRVLWPRCGLGLFAWHEPTNGELHGVSAAHADGNMQKCMRNGIPRAGCGGVGEL